MIFYSLQEILLLVAAAIVIDWVVGDPRWPTHPVIYTGRLIRWLEGRLRPEGSELAPAVLKRRGIVLTAVVTLVAFGVMWGIIALASLVHTWLGYALSAWFISTTIAVKGLKDAALLVYRPLVKGDLEEARKYAGYIVSRDTSAMNERDTARSAIETVAENTVDAFVSPILFALLGAAPLAILYRAANTLDSMVGYKNEKYLYFGWSSARLDDGLNYLPARLSGFMIAGGALFIPGLSAGRALRAIKTFAHLHPSPNSGIPESAAAGAIGIELGGRNVYFGSVSERARLGWPLRPLEAGDIPKTIALLYSVSIMVIGGVLIGWLFTL